MSKIQLERLRNDLMQLDTYINKVRQRGNESLLSKLEKKRNFLSLRLAETS